MTTIVVTTLTGQAIQTAIDTLAAATSNPDGTRPTIRLIQGDYKLDAPLKLTMTDKLSLEMFGAGATYATKLVPTASFPTNAPLIDLTIATGVFGPQSDFILRDFMIDCSVAGQPLAGAVGIRIKGATGQNGSFTANTI